MAHALTLTAAAALALASAAFAQDTSEAKAAKPDLENQETKTLTIGDKAPSIDIEHWIKGDKVAKFEDGKVYVVEFWATWCGPCKASMPHMTSLQKDYKDYGVTFIGISDEPLETVTKFLDSTDKKSDKKWSDVVGYTLTTDPDKSAKNDYFTAAGQRGIPCAFIVGKDQHVEWIGNPHPESGDNFDKALDAVVKDSWNRDEFKAKWEKQEAERREQMEQQQAQMKEMQPLMQAMQDKDYGKAVELADALLAKDPKNLNVGMTKFMALVRSGDTPKAYAYAQELATAHAEEPMILNAIAWTIVDDEAIKDRNYDLALKYAKQANTLSKESNPAILDTLARCYYEKHDLANAVKYEELAVQNLGSYPNGDEIKATLKKYQDEAKKAG